MKENKAGGGNVQEQRGEGAILWLESGEPLQGYDIEQRQGQTEEVDSAETWPSVCQAEGQTNAKALRWEQAWSFQR